MVLRPALLVVVEDEGGKAKVLVQIDYYLKKPKRGVFNVANTGREMDAAALETLRQEVKSDKSGLLLLDGKL